jgi:hypothetical protein
MDHWINRPPTPTEFAGIRLVRVPPNKTIEAIATSETLIGCNTHFAHRRTQPCNGPDCSLCLDGVPARWHGYISIFSTRSRTHAVLELTSLAAQPIADYQDRHGTLRGAQITATRIGNRPNAPVSVSICPCDVDLRTLPRPVCLQKFLTVLWNLETQSKDRQADPHPGPNIRNIPDRLPPEHLPQHTQLNDNFDVDDTTADTHHASGNGDS